MQCYSSGFLCRGCLSPFSPPGALQPIPQTRGDRLPVESAGFNQVSSAELNALGPSCHFPRSKSNTESFTSIRLSNLPPSPCPGCHLPYTSHHCAHPASLQSCQCSSQNEHLLTLLSPATLHGLPHGAPGPTGSASSAATRWLPSLLPTGFQAHWL